MTPFWTAYAVAVECGADGGHLIAAGMPVKVISPAIRRCQEHSATPVDWAAVDAANLAIEVNRAKGEPSPAPLTAARRIRPPRPLLPADAVTVSGVDPKTAAAGGDRE